MRARSLLLIGVMLAASSTASADPQSPSLDRADTLFREGRALMDRGKLDEACARLTESFQLAPRLGTMLNLGGCFERDGQLARALALYERAATMAREAGRPDRERAALALAASVEPRVAKLLLVIGEPTPGLVVEIDGETISMQGGLAPLDPGHRQLTLRAPGKRAWTTRMDAVAGETVRIGVPKLEDETISPIQPPPLPVSTPVPATPRPSTAHASTARTLGIVAGLTLAAAGTTVGIVYGLRARSKYNDSNPHCDAAGCDQTGVGFSDQAVTAGNISTGAFVAAGVGLLASGAFLLFWHSPPAATVGRRVIPTADGIRVSF